MKFKLYLKQSGEGCDYMIGCGSKMINLRSTSREAALEEAKNEIAERTHSECEIGEAILLEAFEDISHLSQEVIDEKAAERQEAKMAEKRRQLEKLKAELGE